MNTQKQIGLMVFAILTFNLPGLFPLSLMAQEAASLPEGRVGEKYDYQIQVEGGSRFPARRFKSASTEISAKAPTTCDSSSV